MPLPKNLSGLLPQGRPRQQTALSPDMMAASQGLAVAEDPAGQQSTPQGVPAPENEQDLYNTFVGEGIKIMFDAKTLQDKLDVLLSKDPRDGVARLTALIVTRLIQSALEQGVEIPLDVILHGTKEIAENAIDFAEAAGVYEFSKNPRMAKGAVVRAYNNVQLEMANMDILDEDEMAGMLEEIQAAEQDGTLAQRLGVTADDVAPIDPGEGMNFEGEDEMAAEQEVMPNG